MWDKFEGMVLVVVERVLTVLLFILLVCFILFAFAAIYKGFTVMGVI